MEIGADIELFKNEKENQKIVNNVVVCNYCNETIKNSGGTKNLASHMRRHHGNVDIDKHDKKGLASMCAPISQGQVHFSTMLKGGYFGTKYPT